MKYVFLFLLAVLFACGSSSDQMDISVVGGGEDGGSTVTAPAAAPENPNSVLTPEPETIAPEVKKDPTVEVVKVDKDKMDERAADSKVAEVVCCAEVTAVTQCCCDKVLTIYEDHLKKKDLDAAIDMEAKDVYYPACARKFKKFEPAIIALQDKYLGK